MAEMRTTYLGFELASPLVASASPMTRKIDALLQLEDGGVGAVVLPSLFEEQVEHDAMAVHHGLEFGAGAFAEAPGGYLPEVDEYNTGAQHYIDLLGQAKEELSIPVIASLNGTSTGGWTLYGRILEDAGADALELNIYDVAADPTVTSEAIEHQYLDLVTEMRESISIPLAVKIGPFFSAMAHFATRLEDAGANALVMFNRFYQPDIDLATLTVKPNLQLSHSYESLLVLRWLAIVRDHVSADLAATTGMHEAEDVVKAILAGANVAMMTSALLRNGPAHAATVIEGVQRWFDERDYASVDQARGSLSQKNIPDPAAVERANYMETLTSYSG
jgi:dihydroorotate dehydrogenase (fumarate)